MADVNPPWRLDPLQNIVDVAGAAPIVVVTNFGAYATDFTDIACGGDDYFGADLPPGTGPWQSVFITLAEFKFTPPSGQHFVSAIYKGVPKTVNPSRWAVQSLLDLQAITLPSAPSAGSIAAGTHGSQENDSRTIDPEPLGGTLHSLNPSDDRKLEAAGLLYETKIPRITERPWKLPTVSVSTFWRQSSNGPLCVGPSEGAANEYFVFQGDRVKTITASWNASSVRVTFKHKHYKAVAVSVPSRKLLDGNDVGGEIWILCIHDPDSST